jgi:hypothetical protein
LQLREGNRIVHERLDDDIERLFHALMGTQPAGKTLEGYTTAFR